MTRKQCFIFLLFLLLLSIIWPLQCKDLRRQPSFDIDEGFDQPGLADSDPSGTPYLSFNIEDVSDRDDADDEDNHAHDEHEDHDDSAVIDSRTERVAHGFSPDPTTDHFLVQSFWRAKAMPLIMGAGMTVIGVGIIAHGIERWAERYIINDLLARYGHSLSTISQIDQHLLHLAYWHQEAELLGSLHDGIAQYGNRFISHQKRQWLLPVIVELHYDCAPTQELIARFCALLAKP